jgi:hypothetical protein
MGSSMLSITNPDEEILLAQCDALLPVRQLLKAFATLRWDYLRPRGLVCYPHTLAKPGPLSCRLQALIDRSEHADTIHPGPPKQSPLTFNWFLRKASR